MEKFGVLEEKLLEYLKKLDEENNVEKTAEEKIKTLKCPLCGSPAVYEGTLLCKIHGSEPWEKV